MARTQPTLEEGINAEKNTLEEKLLDGELELELELAPRLTIRER